MDDGVYWKSFNPEDMTELHKLYKSDLEFVRVMKQNANNIFLQETGGGSGGNFPTGTVRQVMTFGADGKPIAALFNANHWSEFPGGAPTSGIWLAAYIPGSEEVMGFGEADAFVKENTIVLRTSENGPFSGGRIKATPGVDPDDCVTKVQLDTFEIPLATSSTVGGVKTVAAPVINIEDHTNKQDLLDAFAQLIASLKLTGLMT